MITTLLAVTVAPALLAAMPSNAEQQAEQELLQQIHRCAVEEPMPSFCDELMQRLLNNEKQQ